MKHREARSHRGFRRDEEATIAARFEDYRSFISQPKRIPNGCQNEVHLVLYGQADKAPVRAEIFRRNREANRGLNICSECRRRLWEHKEQLMFSHDQIGEWDHIRNNAGERCDCPENGRVLCHECHDRKHPRVRWTAQEAANEKANEAR